MEKYVQLAKKLDMKNVKIISPKEICFDNRAVLKCKWGCEGYSDEKSIKCNTRGTLLEERIEMVKK